jgi:MFS family permease
MLETFIQTLVRWLGLDHFTDHLNNYARRLILGNMINAIGMGLTMTLFLVYLHTIRGFSAGFSGLVMSWMAIIGMVINPAIGILIDKFGGRIVLINGLLIKAVGIIALSFITTKEQALMVATIMALGDAANWPAQTVCLTRLVDQEARQKVFAFNFMALNLGIGIGGIASSLVVTSGRLSSFQYLYWIDSLTYLVYFAFALSLPNWVGTRLDKEDKQSGSYREVFQNKELMKLFRASILLILFGYSSVSAGLPLFLTSVLGASPKWLGIIWAANCFGILLMQAPMLCWLEKHSPTKTLTYVGVIWAASWVLVALCFVTPWILVLPLQITSSVVFGIGETIWSPTVPTVVNQLIPDRIRGRSNALMSLQWGIAGIFGAPLAGFMFDAGLAKVWVFAMIIGCLLPVPLLARVRYPAISK